jgi:hypothetical protein
MKGRNVSCTMVGGPGAKLRVVKDLEENFCIVSGGKTEDEIIFLDGSRCNISKGWLSGGTEKHIVVS